MPKANIILDATILSTLMSCPRLADFRFNHHLVPIGGKSNSLETGSIVHKFLEVYYGSQIAGIKRKDAIGYGLTAAQLYISGCQHCIGFVAHACNTCGGSGKYESESIGDNSIVDVHSCTVCNATGQITKPDCGHKPDDYPGVENTPKESQGYLTGWRWALDTCEQYAEFYKNEHWVPIETEVVKGKVLYEDEDIRILWKAKLDLRVDTNQGIYPADHKTMKQRRKSIHLNNQFIGQCIVSETRGVYINKIGFQTSLKPEEKFERQLLSYGAPVLMEWQSEILPYYAKMLLMYNETGNFPANYSNCESKYGNCNFMEHVCSGTPDMREEELKIHFKVGAVWNPSNDTVNEE